MTLYHFRALSFAALVAFLRGSYTLSKGALVAALCVAALPFAVAALLCVVALAILVFPLVVILK